MKRKVGGQGLWRVLSAAEEGSVVFMTDFIKDFEPLFERLFESTVEVMCLALRHDAPKERLVLAAPFIKRMINDLRGVWISLRIGYTSPSASIACSLYEHSLIAQGLAEGTLTETELLTELDEVFPVKSATRKVLGKEVVGQMAVWQSVYAQYKLLCKIKHPTYKNLKHEIGSTLNEKGTYSVMAAPDVRPEDRPLKALVAYVCLKRTYDVIRGVTGWTQVTTKQESFIMQTEEALKKLGTLIPKYL